MKHAALLIIAVIIQSGESEKLITAQEVSCRRLFAEEFIWMQTSSDAMCIYWSNKRLTFEDARKDCQVRGARLAVAKTPALYENLKVLNSKGYRDTWVGLDAIAQKGVYVWHDGTVLEKKDYRKFWTPENPDSGRVGVFCALMWGTRQLMDDDYCDRSFHYACEKLGLTRIA